MPKWKKEVIRMSNMKTNSSPVEGGGGGGGGRRMRKRLGRCFSGKQGKTIGIASIAAPVAGFIVNDLRKPNSIIRNLLAITAAKLLPARFERRKALDISDKVEIIEDKG